MSKSTEARDAILGEIITTVGQIRDFGVGTNKTDMLVQLSEAYRNVAAGSDEVVPPPSPQGAQGTGRSGYVGGF